MKQILHFDTALNPTWLSYCDDWRLLYDLKKREWDRAMSANMRAGITYEQQYEERQKNLKERSKPESLNKTQILNRAKETWAEKERIHKMNK